MTTPERRKLYRSSDDRRLAGVCGGIAEYFDLDSKQVRIAAVLLLFFTGGSVGLAYLLAMVIVPEESDDP